MDKFSKKRKNASETSGRKQKAEKKPPRLSLDVPPVAPTLNAMTESIIIESTVPSHKRVYTCVVEETNQDYRKEFPMFIGMAEICITPTGFTDIALRDSMCSKVHLMCGEISMAYTNRTTHLLAAHANTTKVELARDRNLPVVTVEWIDRVWEECHKNPYIHASLPQFVRFECSLFHNLHFVFSKRYDLDSKQFYERLLLDNGGIVGNTLKRGGNCFYICQEPETERMYILAQSREVPCLPLAWIVESIHRNNLAKVAEFEVRGKELVGFGTTMDMGQDDPGNRQSLPTPNYPKPEVCVNDGKRISSITFSLDIMDTDSSTLDGDLTLESDQNSILDITERLNDSNCSLDGTLVEDNNNLSKDSFVDTLTFTVAG